MNAIKPTQAHTVILEHWLPEPPDYILALASACEMSSQSKVAQKIGYSGSVVSSVLHNKYPGDLDAVEEKIRATLMQALVECPAIGHEIELATCLENQSHVKAKNRSSTYRLSMMNHCPTCPKSRLGGK